MLTAMGISLLAGGAKMNVVKAADDIPINESTFPDAVFRDYVTKNFDTNSDGVLTEAEREKVSQIFVNESGILDVSNNTALLRLRCSFNHLESLDVSHNTLLQQCDMTNNWMYTMDFSKNTALSDNNIPRIYTTGNVSMKAYRCGEDAYYIDLNDLNLDLSRVSYKWNMGTYDADTGRINFTFANSSRLKGQSFAYIYDTKAPGEKYKNLEVKMTIAEIVDVRDPNATTEEKTTEEVTTEASTTAATTETTTEAPTTAASTTETTTTGTTVTEATTTQETVVEAPTTTQNVAGNQIMESPILQDEV